MSYDPCVCYDCGMTVAPEDRERGGMERHEREEFCIRSLKDALARSEAVSEFLSVAGKSLLEELAALRYLNHMGGGSYGSSRVSAHGVGEGKNFAVGTAFQRLLAECEKLKRGTP